MSASSERFRRRSVRCGVGDGSVAGLDAFALGIESAIAQRERQGAICRPFATTTSSGSDWLVHTPAGGRDGALGAFKGWLTAEIAALQGGRRTGPPISPCYPYIMSGGAGFPLPGHVH